MGVVDMGDIEDMVLGGSGFLVARGYVAWSGFGYDIENLYYDNG